MDHGECSLCIIFLKDEIKFQILSYLNGLIAYKDVFSAPVPITIIVVLKWDFCPVHEMQLMHLVFKPFNW